MKSNTGTRGLGCDERVTVSTKKFDKRTEKKIREMEITQARYNKTIKEVINDDDIDGTKIKNDDNEECLSD